MKKKWIVCLALSVMLVAALVPVTALAAGGVAIDEKNFPDQTFRDYISANFDADKDGVLSAGEVGAAEEIDLAGTDTANLAGLASFPELKKLDVSGTKVTAVNPTKNPALESLNISGCAVKSLDVTRNAALKELDASGTQLTAINVSKNPADGRMQAEDSGRLQKPGPEGAGLHRDRDFGPGRDRQ